MPNLTDEQLHRLGVRIAARVLRRTKNALRKESGEDVETYRAAVVALAEYLTDEARGE